MGQSIPLFLTRAAAIVVAGMLLFAAFGRAHAADGDYGLKRFPGDNYDTVPAAAAYPPAPAPAAYSQAPNYAPAPAYTPAGAGSVPPGYYPTLNSGVTPEVTVSPPAYQPQQAYQAPQSYQPQYQPAPPQPYGYKPEMPAAPAYPAPRLASATPVRGDPYAYYQQEASYGPRENIEYVLGPGDKLRLNVFGEADLSGEFTIDGQGTIRLPLIGQVRAAGYTPPQLEAAIGSALSRGYLKSPRVAVEVSTYRPFYIIGAVNRPGQYPYVDHMNALNAIALAGGFNPNAVESVVFIRREGSNEEVEVPVDRTTAIHPGDVLKVHNTFFADAMTFLSPFSGVAASAATAAVLQ
jgi:protein involved in polysaccharide export with SLBB domain